MKNNIISILLNSYSIIDIENAAIKLFLNNNNISNIKNKTIKNRISTINSDILETLKNNFDIKTIDSLDKLFENLFNEKEKTENGIVFTPDFIADYIVKNTIINFNENTKIIDPSCGCGIFLISTIKHIKSLTNISISNIIKNNLFGIDLQKENIERVKILISLYAIINNEDNEEYKFNLKCCDSLFNDWETIFNVNKFDYIIGNPPYINNHDLKDEYINLLKSNFETTQEGTFNVFYAFIEKSSIYLSDTGKIGYIIPNNFLHIKSAKKLRQYIKNNNLLNTIIDFKDNTVFSPVLTYNSIIFLTKNNTTIKYSQIKKTKNVNSILENINFKTKKINELDDDGWILSNNNVINNIRKIESYNKIDPFIKTGIATLRDKLFILDGYDEEKNFYYKKINNIVYYVEPNITKPFIKISKYKATKKIGRIIFPYKVKNGKASVYEIEEIKNVFPLCYKYFEDNKALIEKKDKGKFITPWYIYGRSQGLNLFDDKIIFSTFNSLPEFMDCPDNEALLSNGYCITNFPYNKILLLKILNSKVMKYYIENTSYSISGDYKCFQKKYIKNFSIPNIDKNIEKEILKLNGEELDEYLFNLYKLDE